MMLLKLIGVHYGVTSKTIN